MNLTASSPWALYDRLIADVSEDVLVRDLCLGTHWSYVEADCGMGVAFTTTRGAQRTDKSDWRGRPLRELAELAKSWCFEEATLGVAALNAWYSRPELVVPLGAQVEEPVELPDGSIRRTDAFEMVRPQVEATSPTSIASRSTPSSRCWSAHAEARSTRLTPPASTCCPRRTSSS